MAKKLIGIQESDIEKLTTPCISTIGLHISIVTINHHLSESLKKHLDITGQQAIL